MNTQPAPLSRAVLALGIGYALAICWVIYADIVYHNNVPLEKIEFHSLYPLGLSVGAVVACLVFGRSMRPLAFRKTGMTNWLWLPLVFVALIILLPGALNVLTSIFTVGKTNAKTEELIGALPVLLILAIAEEVMWRGVVYDTLSQHYSTGKVIVITGICWALWHYPVIIHTHFIYADRPLWFVLPAFTFNVMMLTVIYTYLRKMSNSLWPCVMIHGLSNYVGFALVDTTQVAARPWSLYFKSDIGVFFVVASFALAMVLWGRMNKDVASKLS